MRTQSRRIPLLADPPEHDPQPIETSRFKDLGPAKFLSEKPSCSAEIDTFDSAQKFEAGNNQNSKLEPEFVFELELFETPAFLTPEIGPAFGGTIPEIFEGLTAPIFPPGLILKWATLLIEPVLLSDRSLGSSRLGYSLNLDEPMTSQRALEIDLSLETPSGYRTRPENSENRKCSGYQEYDSQYKEYATSCVRKILSDWTRSVDDLPAVWDFALRIDDRVSENENAPHTS